MSVIKAWEAEAARVLADGFDGCTVVVGREEWAVDADQNGVLVFTHRSGRTVTVHVTCTIVDGALTATALATGATP